MAERHSWAVQQVAGVGVQTVEDVRHSMAALWTPTGAITSRSGLVPTGTAAVPGSVLATTPTANGFVHVQPFRFVLQSVRGGGTYTMVLDSIKDINVIAAQAADPSNSRIDLIIAQQNDAYFGDADSEMRVKQVIGTASGSPVDPTVTGSQDYILLGRVTVPPTATTIQTANIANVPLVSAVAVGGVLPIGGQAERDAIVNPYPGMTVYRRDTNWVETRSATAWRVPDFVKTAALANITNPLTGQVALLTTDNLMYRWTGSAWLSPDIGGEWQANATQAMGVGATKLNFGAGVVGANGVVMAGSNTVTLTYSGRYSVYASASKAFNAANNFGVGIHSTSPPGGGAAWFSPPLFSTGNTDTFTSADRFFVAGTQLCAYLYNNGTAFTLDPSVRPAQLAIWRS